MTRRPLLTSTDVLVFTLTAALLVLSGVSWGWDHRGMNNALSVTVVALWAYRLIGTWHELDRLHHTLVFLGILGPLTATAASLNLLATTVNLPENPWLWAVTGHRAACIAVAIWWRALLDRRHHASPR